MLVFSHSPKPKCVRLVKLLLGMCINRRWMNGQSHELNIVVLRNNVPSPTPSPTPTPNPNLTPKPNLNLILILTPNLKPRLNSQTVLRSCEEELKCPHFHRDTQTHTLKHIHTYSHTWTQRHNLLNRGWM